MRRLLAILLPFAAAASCGLLGAGPSGPKDNGPLAGVKIVSVTPDSVEHDAVIDALCVEVDQPIFTVDRRFTCTLADEQSGPLVSDGTERRACCEPLFFVGNVGRLSVGLVEFNEVGTAVDSINAEGAIEVRPPQYSLFPLSPAGETGAAFGEVYDWLGDAECAVSATWILVADQGTAVDLEVSATGDAFVSPSANAFGCEDTLHLGEFAACELRVCARVGASGPFHGAVDFAGNGEARHLQISGDVVTTPLVDPTFAARGGLFFRLGDGDGVHLFAGPAVDADGAVSLTLWDAASGGETFVRYLPSGELARSVSFVGIGYGVPLAIDRLDRAILQPDYEPIIAIDDANPLGVQLVDTNDYYDRIATHPATPRVAMGSPETLLLFDDDGTVVDGTPAFIPLLLPGATFYDALAMEAAGTTLLVGGWDDDGDFVTESVAMWRVLSDGALDSTAGIGGRMIIARLVDTLANAADAAEAPVPPENPSLWPRAVTVDSSGRVLVVVLAPPDHASFLVLRVLADGTPDPTFGELGIAHVQVEEGARHFATDIAVAADGTIFVVGEVVGSSSKNAIVRLTSSGVREGVLSARQITGAIAVTGVDCGPTACFAIGSASDQLSFVARLQ